MKFYDLNLRGQNYDNDLALVKEANKFGWDYLNLNYSPDNFEKVAEIFLGQNIDHYVKQINIEEY